MTSDISKNAFLAEKLTNFINFLKSVLNARNELVKSLNSLKSYPIQYFVQYIKTSMLPHKDNLDQYVDKLCIEYNINLYEFEDKDKEKLKRYLSCFIEVIED